MQNETLRITCLDGKRISKKRVSVENIGWYNSVRVEKMLFQSPIETSYYSLV